VDSTDITHSFVVSYVYELPVGKGRKFGGGMNGVVNAIVGDWQPRAARSGFGAAAEFYRQAVALHPEIPELQANLGLMYYQTGKDERLARFRAGNVPRDAF
jgi:TPR repeat protein